MPPGEFAGGRERLARQPLQLLLNRSRLGCAQVVGAREPLIELRSDSPALCLQGAGQSLSPLLDRGRDQSGVCGRQPPDREPAAAAGREPTAGAEPPVLPANGVDRRDWNALAAARG